MPDLAKSPAANKLSDTAVYALVSLGLLIVLLVVSLSLFPSPAPHIYFQEEPLAKQPLSLAPGEFYRYSVEGANLSMNVTYVIGKLDNCTLVYVPESQNKTPTCLNAHGNDALGSNVTLESPFFYFFKPWMLAVEPDWQWHVRGYLALPGAQQLLSEIEYRWLGEETFRGRTAYKVEALLRQGEEEGRILYWIDSQQRILLREEGNGYVIELRRSSLRDYR